MVIGLCRNIPAQSCVVMWSHWSQQSRNRLGISTLNSLLTVPKKCYEFKPNPELLKTCVNAMNTL